jgi:hypothetical protein
MIERVGINKIVDSKNETFNFVYNSIFYLVASFEKLVGTGVENWI